MATIPTVVKLLGILLADRSLGLSTLVVFQNNPANMEWRCDVAVDAMSAWNPYDAHDDPRLNHAFEVTAGIRAEESAALLKNFFKRRRR